jgi:N-acylneuraminate cytidylyltransferase
MEPLLALIPARGGSKGLPGKALRCLAGMPLIAHSIELARRCPAIARVVVSTDSAEIADAARSFGADVPFMRPPELARDDTPMWPVVRHALGAIEANGDCFSGLLLLQPSNPARLPEDVDRAVSLLAGQDDADGALGVSEAINNPIWSAMVVRGGFLEALFPDAHSYARRQDVPRVLSVNGALYLWRTSFVHAHSEDPGAVARYLAVEIPARRAIDIDTPADLELAEALIRSGLVSLPWVG